MSFSMVDGGNYTDIGDVPPVIVASPDGTDVQLPAVIIDTDTGTVTVGVTAPDGTVVSTTFEQGVNADGGVTMPSTGQQGQALQEAAETAGIPFEDFNLPTMYTSPDESSGGAIDLVTVASVEYVTEPGSAAVLTVPVWIAQLQRSLGGPINRVVSNAMSAWASSEGMPLYANNPLATTDGFVGSREWNSLGVKLYPSVAAMVDVYHMKFTSSLYKDIGAALKRGTSYQEIWQAVNNSPWCSGCQGGKYPIGIYNLIGGVVQKPLPVVPVQPPIPTATVQPATAKNAWAGMMSAIQNEWYKTGVDAIITSGTFNDALR